MPFFVRYLFRLPVLLLLPGLVFSTTVRAQTGTWTPLTNAAPHYNEGVMLLLTDGTVICKTSSGGADVSGSENIGNVWDRLTPVNGSYVNGTWSTIAAMDSPRLYFSSQVLRDGRVYVCGGEYGGGGRYGEIYDPKTNTWAFTGTGGSGTGHPFPNDVSDANSEMLPDGQVLQASVDETGVNWNYLYNPTDNTYTRIANCLRVDNEAVWVKLPDNSVLFMDNYGQTSERYIPALTTWVNDATAPENLFDPYGFEAGAAFLLPNGKVWFIGSLPNTLYYTPSGTSSPGTWTIGPSIPFSQGAPDASAAMLPNGHILLTLSPTPSYYNHFPSPTTYYEFDYTTNTFTQVAAPTGGTTYGAGCFISNMLVLPDGNLLFCNQGDDQYYVYTPGSGPLIAGKPTINTVSRLNCDSFQVTGTLFNGISEGAAYGDDWQMNTNFPIVRLTAGGNTYYATTYNWNRIGAVATGALPDTAIFQLPAGLPAGTYSVTVIANGNPSAPFTINTVFTISPPSASIIVGGTATFSDSSPAGTWSSGNTAVATVGSTGVVTGIGIGVTQISFSLGAGCYNTATLTVNPSVAGVINGILTLCSGGTTVLSDTATGGVWSSGNTAVAIVGSTGIVAGVSTGTATISYTKSGFSATAVVTVNPQPAPITGSNPICSTGTSSLSDASPGGIWSSTNTAIATVGSTGIVTGVSPGTTTISYTVASSCGPVAATLVVTVQLSPTAGTVTGAGSITALSSSTLTDVAGGGVWSSGNAAVATVGSTGVVTGLTPGTAAISYTVSNSCGSATATEIVTVTSCAAVIITIAGTGVAGYTGDGGLATAAKLHTPSRMALDTAGNIYFADQNNNVIRKINAAGVISTVAGTGIAGYGGDGGPATSAQLNTPYAVDIDTAGNIYIADTYNQRMRKVSPAGIITTIAGTGTAGYSGDGGLATAAKVSNPGYLRLDRSGNIIFSDNANHRIRKINSSGVISTIVGTGVGGYSGDGGPATSAMIWFPQGVYEDTSGNVYISDYNSVIRKVNSSGIISTFAGTGTAGFGGDGGPATAALINIVQDVFVDSVGNLLFTDTDNSRIRRINASGIISTIAGNGVTGYGGDGGPATAAMLNTVNSVAVDRAGNVYISDAFNNRIRKIVNALAVPVVSAISGPATVNVGGTITLSDAAAGGTWSSGSVGVATIGSTSGIVTGVTPGTAMITYMLTNICGNAFATRVVTVSSCSAIISTIAGTGSFVFSGDGGIATLAGMATKDVKTDANGYIYIVDEGNARIRKVNASGIVTTIIGNGVTGFGGDGGPATAAQLNNPNRIAIDRIGDFYIADGPNNRIRKVDTNGIITTVAGSGSGTYGGDGGPALSAGIGDPYGVAVDTAGNIYIADSYNNRIRKVNTSGIITTIAGTGTAGFSGDGGAATAAKLSWPTGVFVDVTGNVYIPDFCNNRIRKINTSGIITTIAGSGAVGTVPGSFTGSYSGDGGAATGATLNGPESITIDNSGNIYISDDGNDRIRKVNPSGIISTVAGIGAAGFSGDGGLATAAKLNSPLGLTLDGAGNILVCDGTNARVRKITNASAGPTVGPIVGPTIVSVSGNITLADTITGGTWSSGTTGVATVGVSSGIVTGVSAGTSMITYTVGNPCGSAFATLVVTVALVTNCSPIITTIAGTTVAGHSGDGGLATAAQLCSPDGIAMFGNSLYVGSVCSYCVRKIDLSTGIITAFAGTGVFGYTGDGGPATSAKLAGVYGVSVDTAGNVYIADEGNYVIRKVNTSGIITTVAGTGVYGFSGDGGPATSAKISDIDGVAPDYHGNFLIADLTADCIRKVNTSGIISTIAGIPLTAGSGGDGGPATAATFQNVPGVNVDTAGNIMVSDLYNHKLREINTSGIVNTVAGTGVSGYTGDGGPAVSAKIYGAVATFKDVWGDIFFGDSYNNVVRKVNTSGIITTVAGTGAAGHTGDGGLATSGTLHTVGPVTGDKNGHIYVCDYGNNCVRKITFPPSIINGAGVLCIETTITLSDSIGGGIWTSATTAVASVGSVTGIVTGITAGTATIYYSANGCSVSKIVTVNGTVTVGPITGSPVVCVGATTILSDVIDGGVWSSSAPGIASVGSSGLVTGVLAGTATISYTASSCGSSGTALVVTVSPLPAVGPISGAATMCPTSTTLLSDATSGGTWSSSALGIATVGSSGLVTGVSSGTATISYTINTCGIAVATQVVTVSTLPAPGTITGVAVLCATSTTQLSDVNAGGTWSSTVAGIATISSTGLVSGVSSGTTVISYTLTNGCGSAAATQVVTVNTSTSVTPINGSGIVCMSSTIVLTDATAGGVWSSSPSGVVSVGTSGFVSGISVGTATVSYSLTSVCGTSVATSIVTVNPLPNAGVINGTSSLCLPATTSLSDLTAGGSWSSTAGGIATVGSSGLVTGVSVGTATISYAVTNSCGTNAATRVVTVNSVPVVTAVSGASAVCVSAAASLSDLTAGGTWSSTATGVATVGSSGIVNGVSGGTAIISYIVTNSCGIGVASKVVTVDPLPNPGAIIGVIIVCGTGTTQLTDLAFGGTWSSTLTSIATVGSGGLVTGVSAGTTIISYTVSNSCGAAAATQIFTVDATPVAGTITGVPTICGTATTQLSDLAPFGVWSSTATGVAVISSGGLVTGISTGTAIISYAVTNSCNTVAATKIVTVNPLPVAGTISGTPQVCTGVTTQLTDLSAGGVWSSAASAIASVGSAGLVLGVSPGTATISYTVANGCGTVTATQIVTINVSPIAGTITGAGIVCAGSATLLSDLAAGGVWSSSATSTATVGSAGLLAGVSAGTSTISYVVINSCGIAITTKVITVDPLPAVGSISGTAVLCEPSSVLLSDVVSGGTWSSGSAGVATVGTDGTVTGIAAGTAIITYSVTNNCGTNIATMVVTINPLPQAGTITGTVLLCQLSSTTLTDASPGGIWSSSNTAVASIGSSGLLSGIAGGTAMISYSVTNSCGTAVATSIVTVNPQPDAGVITGADSLCIGSVIALSDLTAGGVWSTDVAGVATVGTAGNVTGISAGVATISYTVTNDCGSVRATMAVTVNPAPDAGVITGNLTLCSGQTTSLSDIVSGGLWSSNNTGTATVSSAGIVSGVTAGTAIISYAVTNSCGTTPVVATVTVNPLPDAGVITGPHHVCIGQIIQLADTASGMWGIDNAGIATISVSGVVNGLQPGVDTVSYSVTDGNGCSASAHFVVTVNPLPFIGPIYGADPVCIGAQVPLTDVASGGTWSSSNTSLASVGSSSGSVNAIAPGTVTITYTLPADANGCTNDTVFMLTITTVPDFTISGTVTNVNCYGGSDGSIVVAVNGGNGPFKYLWSTGDSSAQLVNIVPATYSIQVKDINTQCVLSDSFAINQPDSLNVVATITGDHCKGGNGEIVLVVSGGTAPYQYLWSNNVTRPQLAGLLAGNYTVVVSDVKNCSKTEQLQVADGTCDDLVVHNGISPNGDGENDTWIIDGIQNYRNNVVQIFDKWGDMVYEQNGYNNTWAGKASNGSELPSGTYIYVLKLNARNQSGGKDQMSGTLLLKR